MRVLFLATAAAVITTCLPAEAQKSPRDIFGSVIPKGPTVDELRRQAEEEAKRKIAEAEGQARRKATEVATSSITSWTNSGGADDRSSVRTYAREDSTGKYVFQGILIGATTGVAANCAANAVSNQECLKNAGTAAVVGGTLGAAGGWYTASQKEKYANEAEKNSALLESARLEVQQARLANEAAVRLVDKRGEQLKLAREEAKKNKKKQAELNKAIEDARADRVSLQKSIIRLDGEKSAIKAQAETVKNRSARMEYERIVLELEAQKTALDGQIIELDGAIEAATA